jgi:hypothetical protein
VHFHAHDALPAESRPTAGDTQRVAVFPDALRLLGVMVTDPVSRRPVRPLADEAMRPLPGDELVADAKIRWSQAITIQALPPYVWPWLVRWRLVETA